MVFKIEDELDAALKGARASGDAALARSCELSAVPDSLGSYSVETKADSLDAAFEELDRMVNDTDVPIERARQLRLYLAWKGHLQSQYLEGYNFHFGRNIQQDHVLARYWYTKAAERGDSCAQNNLGVLFADGLGGDVDHEKAVYWYMRSVECGDIVAKGNLGGHLADGTGVRRNYRRAASLLKEYLKSYPYSAKDHLRLARCYEHGVAGRNGRRLAMLHYQEAADFGSAEARTALRRLKGDKGGDASA